MCGIIGYVGNQQAVPVVIEGLRRLEYRGYDSAGIAVINGGKIEVRRRPGKLHGLLKAIQDAQRVRRDLFARNRMRFARNALETRLRRDRFLRNRPRRLARAFPQRHAGLRESTDSTSARSREAARAVRSSPTTS